MRIRVDVAGAVGREGLLRASLRTADDQGDQCDAMAGGDHGAPLQADSVVSCTLPSMVTFFSRSPLTLKRNHGCSVLAGVPKLQSLMLTSVTGGTAGMGCGPL